MLKNKLSVKTLTYTAICIAMALVLSRVKLFSMPQGGSVTACSMFFITLAGYWFGPVVGVTAGVAAGMLDLLLGGTVVHPVQLLMDYPLAFGVLGLAGFFRDRRYGLHVGYVTGALARLIVSTLSGWIFFGSYAPAGTHPAIYSLGYNSSYILPEMAITLVIMSIPAFRKAIDLISAPSRV